MADKGSTKAGRSKPVARAKREASSMSMSEKQLIEALEETEVALSSQGRGFVSIGQNLTEYKAQTGLSPTARDRYNEFVNRVVTSGATTEIDVDAVSADFRMSRAGLAQLLGVPAETFYMTVLTSADLTLTRLRAFLAIIGHVEPWAGGPGAAMAWYRNQPIPSLGGLTAEALVQQDKGELVDAYLERYAAGGYA
jgi:hypothetical protein